MPLPHALPTAPCSPHAYLDGLKRAQGNVGKDLCAGRAREVDQSLILFEELLPGHVCIGPVGVVRYMGDEEPQKARHRSRGFLWGGKGRT